MKSLRFTQTLFLASLVFTAVSCGQTQATSQFAADDSRQIYFDSYFDIDDYQQQTYLSFMRKAIKPAMDTLATDGYVIKGAASVKSTFKLVDAKIKRKVTGRWGGLDKVSSLADKLKGQKVNLNTLPAIIAKADPRADRYGLSTFLGLASGGGVKIKYFESNYGLNVHYDVKEQRSGRSFGVGPTRMANDASDKNYLDDLEDYVTNHSDNTSEFYYTLFQSLLDSNATNYINVEDEGQTVLTDFLSVFTAEQARNLMDGRVSPHWDAALLEVTLLASFHAGQETLKLYYKNPETGETDFTDETLRQSPCKNPDSTVKARLNNYWQFSRNVDSSEHCRRSGINITKREFRKLGEELTDHVYKTNAALAKKIESSLGLKKKSSNFFKALSYMLISDKAPATIEAKKVQEITDAWVEFLALVKADAKAITKELSN